MNTPQAQSHNTTPEKPRRDDLVHGQPPLGHCTTSNDATSKGLEKVPSNQSASLGVPVQRRGRSQSPDTRSIVSGDFSEFSEFRHVSPTLPPSAATNEEGHSETEPAEGVLGWKASLRASWLRNKGLVLVVISQIFATLMSLSSKLLETRSPGEEPLDPFQILFARMSITTVFSSLYMWWNSVEDFPLGAKDIRWILVARGIGGFFGVYGMYWSLSYLSLSDATVLTFIAPMISCWVCSKLLKESFTRVEQAAACISLVGVVLIAQPASLFSRSSPSDWNRPTTPPSNPDKRSLLLRRRSEPPPNVTPSQRLAAVGMSMVGVLGAVVAYTTIRWIGKRAHPLISVNYFAAWCTIVSSIALVFIPSVPFILPHTLRQWLLLIAIGVTGFVMQYLLTAGLRYEKGSRATNMVYCQMLFALAIDKLVWGTTPTVMSLIGSSLILGGAIVVAIHKEKTSTTKEEPSRNDEEYGLLDEHHRTETETEIETEYGTEGQDFELEDARGGSHSRGRH
ncbi:MAG: hypothetical protein M1831_006021 [Alyxoria varia]|nr:MAG: hypothetical protein M1831_006021 [Alyxoria varia]